MTWESRHLSIVIERPAAVVYDFVLDPTNLPRWAAGLASASIEHVDGRWLADSPMGRVEVDFVERNEFGVLDHTVTLPSGERVHNPLRVIPAGEDSEVVFSLRRRPGMTDRLFDEDAEAVRSDLATLKRVLESR